MKVKQILNRALYGALYGTWYLLSLLPMWVHYALADVLYVLVAHVLRYRRRVIDKNLLASFPELSDEERKALVEKDKRYGRIICRCEGITEGEIIDAIKAPCGARDVDGVKRRTRAGMGRCQGGFCGSKVVEILARELGEDMNEVTKFGNDSVILYERTK